MSEQEGQGLPSFRYELEKQPPKPGVGPGGTTRQASVHEFPVSTGIAGVSMRLEPGGMRELHWHANAAEWAYVVEGYCRTTILHPTGDSVTDDFGPGDVWYFPKGYGHSIQGLGPGECHFLLIFDNGYFSEDHTFSVTDWIAHTPTSVAAQNLGLSEEDVASLPSREVYFAKGPVPAPELGDREAGPQSSSTGEQPSLVTTHRYPLEAQEPREFAGGTIRLVTVEEFPISTTMAGAILELEPGAIREMHWHPNADEWQYYMSGTARMTVFMAQGNATTAEFEAGDVGYAPQGSGHYIENTGNDVCRVLITFNSGHYQEISLSEWLASNPTQLLATNFEISESLAERFPREERFIVSRSDTRC
jgi:oxalate decarboxylase